MGAIEVRGLTKCYGDVVAVDGLDLSVEAGELFGLLGPNGAGKSTLINVLCTLLAPTGGTATVAGHDVREAPGAVRERIGVVFQEPALDEELTGAENLAFHGRLYGMRDPDRAERIDEVLDLVDLADRRDERVGNYSGGMARRLELARGLLHGPAVLFLDEPTVGLDAGTRNAVREYVRDLNARTGVTVVLTTHYMDEAASLCDRVAVVDRGSVVACDTPDALTARLGGDHVEVGVDDPEAARERVAAFDWVETVALVDGGIEVVVDSGERRVASLLSAVGEVASVSTVAVRKPTLEQVFLELTGRTLRGDDGERARTPDGLAPTNGHGPGAG
jgi:ABC-2 type transport system ATP-binding protein